ncbi:MAG: amidohydrolase family protein [Candidatus Latescibacterota bacterium]|nr:amidohydrolase family protein [Candidatus Latescibacterota bacterium]
MPAPVIDAHLHVFAKASEEFPRKVSDQVPAEREATAEQLLDKMEKHQVDGAVLVQFGGNSLETHAYLLHCLHSYPDRFLGIGLIPADSDAPGDHMDRLRDGSNGRIIGVRLSNLGGPEDPFEPVDVRHLPVYPIWEHAARRDYVIWLYPRARDAHVVPHLFEAFPEVRVVFNHLMVCPGPKFWWDKKGRPQADVPMPPETRYSTMGLKIGRILENTRGTYPYDNVCVHISGQYAFSTQAYPYPDLAGWHNSLRMVFGSRRMMWATDFPWILADPGYRECIDLVDELLPDLSVEEKEDVMGRTTATFLRFSAL